MKKLKKLLCNKDFCLGDVFVSMFVVCVGASLASISISLGLGLVAFGGVFAVPSIIISDKLLKKQNSNNQENIKVNNSKTNNNSQQNNNKVLIMYLQIGLMVIYLLCIFICPVIIV